MENIDLFAKLGDLLKPYKKLSKDNFMNAKIIYPTGKVLEIASMKDHASLEWMQKTVGGLIEIVTLTKGDHQGQVMVINESGKLLGLPTNKLASQIHNNHTDNVDEIVGKAILLESKFIK